MPANNMPANKVTQPVRYGLGSFCTGTFSTVPGLLLYYLTNVPGVRAAVAGPPCSLPKASDLFVNPLIGRLSESTRSRRAGAMAVRGAATLPVIFALTFGGPLTCR